MSEPESAIGDTGPLVIIVAYQSDDELGECLACLGQELRVTIVDNGRSPQTRAIAETTYSRYIEASGNIGFAAAVNLGLRETWDGVADVLLLNPDARVASDDVFRLQEALRREPRLAAVGPLLVGLDGMPQKADWPLPSPGQVWADAVGLGPRWRGPRFVVGAVLMLRAEALAALGGLDERYFLYAEEADWQLAAQRGGWRVAVVTSASAVHAGSASSTDANVRDQIFHASGETFGRKWYGTFGWNVMRLGSVLAAARRSTVGPPIGRRDSRRTLAIYLRGSMRAAALSARRSQPGRVVQVVRSDGFAGVERYVVDVSNELDRRGWQVVVIGGDPALMRTQLSPSINFEPASTVASVARALWRVGPGDVVHAHMTAAEFPAALLKRRLRGQLVVTRHFATSEARSFAGRLARTIIARRVDCFIAISQFVADSIPEAATVIWNGTPTSSIAAEPREQTVVVMQRFEPEKDTTTALEAWAKSGLADRGWQLVLAGRGRQHAELAQLAKGLGIDDSVEFFGFVSDPRALLARAGIMLATAPSEPFGLAVIEAMAVATPVVAARGGAHTETLNEHGRFFAAGDSLECAKHLVDLATDPQMRTQLGLALQKRQRALFSVGSHVDQLERAYQGASRT